MSGIDTIPETVPGDDASAGSPHGAANWSDLIAEFDRWAERGTPAGLWWRDDDTTDVTPEFESLLALAERLHVPVGLAVIPRDSSQRLRRRAAWPRGTAVLQHGYAHTNHAAPGTRKCEFNADRPVTDMEADLRAGWRVVRDMSGALPVFVPPWNRIAPEAVNLLPACGLRGLSTFGTDRAPAPSGLAVANTHVDVIAWRQGRTFVGESKALGAAIGHLRARRTGAAPAAPTGVLTHHAVHDGGTWAFLDTLAALVNEHPGARWCAPKEVFGL